jgi:hypothetical protein
MKLHRWYLKKNIGIWTRGPNAKREFCWNWFYHSDGYHCSVVFSYQQWYIEQQSISFPKCYSQGHLYMRKCVPILKFFISAVAGIRFWTSGHYVACQVLETKVIHCYSDPACLPYTFLYLWSVNFNIWMKLHTDGEVRVLKLEDTVQQDAAIQNYELI